MQPDYDDEGLSLAVVLVMEKTSCKEELDSEGLSVCLQPAQGSRCPSELVYTCQIFGQSCSYRKQCMWQRLVSYLAHCSHFLLGTVTL